MNHLKIIQGNLLPDTEEVDMTIINKLYELASSGDLDAASELKGYLHLLVGDRAKIEYLTNMFPNKLFITANNYLIPFEDLNMVTYLNSLGIGSNGTITEDDAAAATIVANSANTTVTKFNELKYFTQITQSRGGWDSYDSGYVRFCGWTALEEVDISNFTSLGHSEAWGYEDTFSDCTSLKKVTASNKLTKIGVCAFNDCQNLEEITGLSGTVLLGISAFFRCKKLTNESFSNVQILFNVTSDINREHSTFEQTNLITSLTLSDLNTVIPSKAFLSSKIRTINIPSGVYCFAAHCFHDSDLAIDASLISNAETYKQYCFAYSKITGTFAPTNLITLEASSFEGCSSLQGVDLSGTSLTRVDQTVFSGATSLASVILPSTCTTIKAKAFDECTSLATINLSNVSTIEWQAFYQCSSLTSVNLDSCTSLGTNAFTKTGLTSLDLSNTQLTEIPNSCFQECPNLGLVKLPATCTILRPGCFCNDPNLQISATDLARITVLDNNCLSNSGLSGEYSFPNLTTINGGPFNGTKVTKLDFTGSTFTQLGAYFCNGVTTLTKIILPDTLQEILGTVLAGCTGLQYIKCLATTPPTVAGIIGAYLNNPTFKIYVPDASVNAYKAATSWSDHSARIFGLSQFATDFPNG